MNAAAERDERTLFGFWVYLMSDCLLFGSLFAAFAVLRNGTFGGPSPSDLFNLPVALLQTLLLLTSSFLCGLAILFARQGRGWLTFLGLGATFLLGAAFLALELREFAGFIQAGHSWRQSASLSSFFTLVGTHGFHVTMGLLWMAVMGLQLLTQGFTPTCQRRLSCLAAYWHFLDVVWIFLFTVVYLIRY